MAIAETITSTNPEWLGIKQILPQIEDDQFFLIASPLQQLIDSPGDNKKKTELFNTFQEYLTKMDLPPQTKTSLLRAATRLAAGRLYPSA